MNVEAMQKAREMTFIADLAFNTLTPQEMRLCVELEGLKREYLKNPDAIAVFDALMAAQGEDDTACYARIIDVFNGRTDWLNRDCRKSQSCIEAYAKVNVRRLAETARKQIRDEVVDRVFADIKAGRIDLYAAAHKLADAQAKTSNQQDGDVRTLNQLGPQVPEEENPNALFRNGWLRKGNGAVLVAETGKGKSVLSLQMAFCWARGVPAFGIEPMKIKVKDGDGGAVKERTGLKIAVFQTEDDDDEMRRFRDDIKRGLREKLGWTEAQIESTDPNIHLIGTKGLTGENFVNHLRRKLFGGGYDLVIINPLQGVFGGDLINNAELSGFLRVGLDGVITSELTKCGVLIVHHTNKPPQDPRMKRTDAYLGAGGAELANWMRAMLVLDEQKDGTFHLLAAKRGQRLDWPTLPNHGQPYREIRHAPKDEDLIFWIDSTATAGTGETKEPEETLEDMAKRFADALKEKAKSGSPCTKTEARALARKLFSRKIGNGVYCKVIGNLDAYGLDSVKTGNSTGEMVVLKNA